MKYLVFLDVQKCLIYLKSRDSRITLCKQLFKIDGKQSLEMELINTSVSLCVCLLLVHWVKGDGRVKIARGVLLVCTGTFQVIHCPVCAFHLTLLYCIYYVYIGQMNPNFIISSLQILKRLPMYDKSRVSKLTHFVHFVLKFIERLSSENDFWKW